MGDSAAMKPGLKSFRERRTFIQRVQEAKDVRDRFPEKVPVIIERCAHSKELSHLDKRKYLIPDHVRVAELVQILRRRLQLKSSQSLFLIVNDKNLAANASTFEDVYRDEMDPDGFLYIRYASQEVFGC